MKSLHVVLTAAALTLATTGSARATVFHGVDFPDGAVSFADAVQSFDPPPTGSGRPSDPYLDPTAALGAPDYPEGPGIEYVSLGDGGSITLRFTDNSLTGSGDSADDLWIFEIGPDVEDTFVEISKDGSTWHSVGKVFGATSGIDIDAYGWGFTDFFSFVRLTDDTNEGQQSGSTVGADIDAVGAISSAPPVPNLPEPASLLLLASGLAGTFLARRRR